MEEYEDILKRYQKAVSDHKKAVANLKKAKKKVDETEKVALKAKEEINHVSAKIDVIEKALDDIRPVQPYTVSDIFNPDFLKQHTDYDDCDEFFSASGVSPQELLEFKKHPRIMNKLARKMTDFNTFDEFIREAVLVYRLKDYGITEVPNIVRDGTKIVAPDKSKKNK